MNWIQRRYWYHKLKGSPYQPLFASVQKGEYVSLDCETTSLDPKRAELVTIGSDQNHRQPHYHQPTFRSEIKSSPIAGF